MESAFSSSNPTALQPQPAPAAATSAAVQAPNATAKTVTRHRATPAQGTILMASFTTSQHAGDVELERLEKETGLPRKFIVGWFGRQRQKAKKVLEKQQAAAAASGVPSTVPPTVAEGASVSFEVKKEACDAAMISQSAAGDPPVAGQKKRQRQAKGNAPGKPKKRKIAPVPEKPVADTNATSAAADSALTSGGSAVLPASAKGKSSTGPGSETGLVRSASSLLFEKIQVKLERYTPPPDEILSSHLPALSTAEAVSENQQAQISRPQSVVAEAMNNPKASGERRCVIPNTSVPDKKGLHQAQDVTPFAGPVQASMPERMTSPSDVAMKSRRKRDIRTGEESIPPWQAYDVESSSTRDSGGVPTSSKAPQAVTATNFDYSSARTYETLLKKSRAAPGPAETHFNRFRVPLYSHDSQYSYTRQSVLRAPTPPPGPTWQVDQHRIQASYSAPADIWSVQPQHLPFAPQSFLPTSDKAPAGARATISRPYNGDNGPMSWDGTQAFCYGAMASFEPPTSPPRYGFEAPLANIHEDPQNSSRTPANYDAPSPWVSPRLHAMHTGRPAEVAWLHGRTDGAPQAQYDAMSYYTPFGTLDAGCLQESFLDPHHAPLKHLTGIVSPLCDSLGVPYDKLATLNGEQRHVVIEKLLDEDMGEKDPFKAAMGLVMASKLGLRWD